MHYHARDMAVVRGAHRAESRWCCRRRRRRSKPKSMRGAAATGGSRLPERFGGQRLPSVEAIDLRRERPPPRPLHRAGACRRGEDRDRARRAGAALPQPPRLCAADAVPRLRLPLRLPELRRLAGRSPLPQAARLPSLRLRHAASGRVPEMPGGEFASSPSGRASSGWRKRCASCFRGARMLVLSSDLVATVERLREELDDVAAGRFDIVIGTQLVAKGHHFPKLNLVGVVDADLGLEQRRSARGRAHVPAPASGGRPRRPRRRPRLRLSADASARASGDARADRAGPRGVLRRRDRGARDAALSAVRAAREPGRLRRRQARRREGFARALAARRAARATTCACSARPRRRSRWCAAAIASACWSKRRAPSISRLMCANGWRGAEAEGLASSSKSTSIRRAFCDRHSPRSRRDDPE